MPSGALGHAVMAHVCYDGPAAVHSMHLQLLLALMSSLALMFNSVPVV
jgi:hypothetical protein